MAAVIPTAIAGSIGVYQSQQALRQETLCNLNQEVSIRAKAVGHFFDQFSADMLTLAASRTLKELNIARAHGNQAEIEAAVKRLETRYIWVTPPGKKYCGHPNKSPAERIGVIFLKPQMLQSIFANRIDQSHC